MSILFLEVSACGTHTAASRGIHLKSILLSALNPGVQESGGRRGWAAVQLVTRIEMLLARWAASPRERDTRRMQRLRGKPGAFHDCNAAAARWVLPAAAVTASVRHPRGLSRLRPTVFVQTPRASVAMTSEMRASRPRHQQKRETLPRIRRPRLASERPQVLARTPE